MRTGGRPALLCALLLMVWSGAAGAWHLVDAQGHHLSGPGRVQRFVTLSPALAELVFAAGAGSHLAGTVAYSSYPSAAKQVPRVGNAFAVNLEALLAVHPGLVLAWGGGTPPTLIRRLRALGVRVAVLRTVHLADVARHLRLIGRLAGTSAVADRAARRYLGRLSALRHRYAAAAPIKAFFQVSLQPLYTVGGQQVISHVLKLCGARNIFGRLPEPAPRVSVESVMAANPDVIVYPNGFSRRQERRFWRRFPQIRAVRKGHLIAVPADAMTRPAPRLLGAARSLCRRLAALRRGGGGGG